MEGKKLKRIIFEVSEDFHKRVKMLAADDNMSIKSWVLKAIVDRIKNRGLKD